MRLLSNKTIQKTEKPLVSVIIPVYNAEKYIKQCLLRLINQPYENLQILCIDDGSTDNSLSIIKKFAKRDKRILYTTTWNNGPAHARNIGLNMATGDYISFVDADDFVENDIYTTLVDIAETNSSDIVVFGAYPSPNSDRVPEWIRSKTASTNAVYDEKSDVLKAFFCEESSRPFLWLHFIKRKLFETPTKIRFNEEMDLGEDQVLQFEYFPRAEKVVFTDKKLYSYRWNREGSLMWEYNNKRLTKFEKHIKLVETVFSTWNKSGYDDKENYLPNWAVNFLYPDWINLPKFFQYKFSKQIIEIASANGHGLDKCTDTKAIEIIETSLTTEDYERIVSADIDDLKNEINRVEEQIQSILISKKFKLGRIFTSKKKRIDINFILPRK